MMVPGHLHVISAKNNSHNLEIYQDISSQSMSYCYLPQATKSKISFLVKWRIKREDIGK